MFTKKKFCNRGYGSILIKYVKDEVSKSKKCYFLVQFKKKAINFYIKNGFVEKGNFFDKKNWVT